MKKLIVCLLSLAVCLSAAGCKTSKVPAVYPEIRVGNIELTVGETPDWTKEITVTLNGETLDSADCVVTLQTGDPTKAGRCVYKIIYPYKDVEVTARAYVNYTKGVPVEPDDPDPDTSALSDALKKTYRSYTFRYQSAIDGAPFIDETNRVDGMTVEIDGEDILSGKYRHYIRENDDNTVTIFYESNGKWISYSVAYEYYVTNMGDYMPFAFTLSEYALSADMFEEKGDGYAVKTSRVDTVAAAVFGFDPASSDVYTSIELTLSDGHVASVTGAYQSTDDTGDYASTVTYTWTDFDNTVVTLPQAEEFEIPPPEHVGPDGAAALTQAQQTTLTAALAAEYDKASYAYANDKGALYLYVTENGRVDGNKTYAHYTERAVIDGVEKYSDTREYYLNRKTDSLDVYEVTSQYGDWNRRNEPDGAETDYAQFVAPAGLGLQPGWFGYKENRYVVKADALKDAETALGTVFDFAGAFNASELITFTATADGAGHIVEWYMLVKFTAKSTTDYWQLSYTYDDIGAASVVLPDYTSPRDATEAEKTALTGALAADFTNVTVTETMGGATARFAGAAVRVDGEANHEPFTDNYAIEGGKYYEVVVDHRTEIPHAGDAANQTGFDYYVPHFHFEAVDPSAAKYDEAAGAYLFDAADLALTDFVYYWYYPGYVCGGFSIKLSDGKIDRVSARFSATVEGVTVEFSVTARLFDYGRTSAADQT